MGALAFTGDALATWVAEFMWPFLRITGLCLLAPLFGQRLAPVRVRIILAVALTVMLMPGIPTPAMDPAGLPGIFTAARELLIGVAMGFMLQMVFDAMVIAGQAIAMSMGLGFATMVDPARGNLPVVSQFFVLVAMLLFLAMNGHLVTLSVLAQSFHTLPIGESLAREGLWTLVNWGTQMFAGALQIALPALTALLTVNIAFGVMSRAAPSMNLFAVGFPVTMTLGFVIMVLSIGNLQPNVTGLVDSAHALIRAVFQGGG